MQLKIHVIVWRLESELIGTYEIEFVKDKL